MNKLKLVLEAVAFVAFMATILGGVTMACAINDACYQSEMVP